MRADFGYDKKAGEQQEDEAKDLTQKVFRAIKGVQKRIDALEESQKTNQVELAKRMLNQDTKIQELSTLTDKQKTEIEGLNSLIADLKT